MLKKTTTTLAALVAAAVAAWAPSANAHVTRIVVDSTVTPVCVIRNSSGVCTQSDATYEEVTGRAFGALDPNDPHNALITDLPPNATYVASFRIRKLAT